MTDANIWWSIAGTLVVLELMTGTFYLLMLALGMAAAALVAQAGAALAGQLLCAALVGGAAVVGWHVYQQRTRPQAPDSRNKDLNMDIGATVQVPAWEDNDHAVVRYRGAQWQACLAPGSQPSAGAHRIVEVRGSELVLEKIDA